MESSDEDKTPEPFKGEAEEVSEKEEEIKEDKDGEVKEDEGKKVGRGKKRGRKKGEGPSKQKGKSGARKSRNKGVASVKPRATVDRPVRERKTVERFAASTPRESVPAKALSIKKGRGSQLKDIPNVAFKLSKRKTDENLQVLHSILFGKKTKVYHVKRNISQFSGFVWDNNQDKQRAKVKEKIDKCIKDRLLDFCDVLDIPVLKATAKKEELTKRLLEFLESPHPTRDVLLAEKEQSRAGKRLKKKAGRSKASGDTDSTSKKRKRNNEATEAKRLRAGSSKAEIKKTEDQDESAGSVDVSDEDEGDEMQEEQSGSEENGSEDVGEEMQQEQSDPEENGSEDEGEEIQEEQSGPEENGSEDEGEEMQEERSEPEENESEGEVKKKVQNSKGKPREKTLTAKKGDGAKPSKSTYKSSSKKVSSEEDEDDDLKEEESAQEASEQEESQSEEEEEYNKKKTESKKAKKLSKKDVQPSPKKKLPPVKKASKTAKSRGSVKTSNEDKGKGLASKSASASDEKKYRKNTTKSGAAAASSKERGKVKAGPKSETRPTKEEMLDVVKDILKEVDFNTVTLADIVKRLGKHFKTDLAERKLEVRDIIEEVINDMTDEEDGQDEAKEAGEDSGEDRDDNEG